MLGAFYEILSGVTPADVQGVGIVWSRTPCNRYHIYFNFFFFTDREIYVSSVKCFYVVSILHEDTRHFIGSGLGRVFMMCWRLYTKWVVVQRPELFFFTKNIIPQKWKNKLQVPSASSHGEIQQVDTFCFPRDSASFEETPSEFLKWCHKDT